MYSKFAKKGVIMMKFPEIIQIDSENESEVITKQTTSNPSISKVSNLVQFDLNLDLTLQSPEKSDEATLPTTTTKPAKIFPCACYRKKFKSSHAPGGHQNGHNSEKSKKKSVKLSKKFSATKSAMGRYTNEASLGMQTHSLDHHRPGPSSTNMLNNFIEGGAEGVVGNNCGVLSGEGKLERFCLTGFPGRIRVENNAVQQTDTSKIDLTLKL